MFFNAVVSSMPNMMFRHWTPCPDAPLTILSIAENSQKSICTWVHFKAYVAVVGAQRNFRIRKLIRAFLGTSQSV